MTKSEERLSSVISPVYGRLPVVDRTPHPVRMQRRAEQLAADTAFRDQMNAETEVQG